MLSVFRDFFKSMRAVLWSFLGIRGEKGHQQDMLQLNPVCLILAVLLCAAIFIIGLLSIVFVVI